MPVSVPQGLFCWLPDSALCPSPFCAVTVTSTSSAVSIQSALVKKDNASVAAVSKRYVRYLTKKYLAKEGLVEYLRVLADGPEGYKITFYNLGDDEEEEEADE